jgi:hypothetical protein
VGRIATILAFALIGAPVQASAQAECDDECVPIVREAILWVLDEFDLDPHELVLDTARSGIGRVDPDAQRQRIIPVHVFGELARAMGVRQSTAEKITACAPPPAFPGSCSLMLGTRYARIAVHEIGDVRRDGRIVLSIGTGGGTGLHPDRWHIDAHHVTLRRVEGRWQVTEVTLFLSS